jgi:hypothetical protein
MANGELELLRQIHDRIIVIDEKLDGKCDKDDCDLNAEKIHALEAKTSKLMVKQAGVAGVATGLMLALKQLLAGDV